MRGGVNYLKNGFERMHLYLDEDSRSRLAYLGRISNQSKSAVLRLIIQGAAVREMPPADYHAMTAELYRIGTNLNQLAKVANMTGQIDSQAYNKLALELKGAIFSIQQAVDAR